MADIGRRQFGAALISGSTVVWLSGCGGGSDTDLQVPGPGPESDRNVHITSNHGHVLVIPPGDLNSLVAKVYDMRGKAADHTHQVVLDAEQFQLLRAGQSVAVGSGLAIGGSDVHSHTIAFNGDFIIGGNHAVGPHSILITTADLDRDGATFNIAGQADHSHTVVFIREQLQALKAGQRIEAISSLSDDGTEHLHAVTIFAAV